ncbi:TIGR00251 family protein [Edhazardia aedis USNM 41457]|uniref:TIGR00251 family protein n=1 Tax=Edhazardia aedis (strain USNM 41457) TaxID=1003232 RepID=J8ZR65_EDHAE|nr:TIGR00251 family protein [Edhazardia aedis USNM 41457]|eukprot:EJW02183.1 TIGR00251 family protein [Edhazardia aedis USNM 41457]
MFYERIGENKYKIFIKIFPDARENCVCSCDNYNLTINIRAKPLNNKANTELKKFLAKLFVVNGDDIKIIYGHKEKSKCIVIENVKNPEKLFELYANYSNCNK